MWGEVKLLPKKKLVNGIEDHRFGDSKVAVVVIIGFYRPVPIRRRVYNFLTDIKRSNQDISVFILIDRIEKSDLQETVDGIYYLSVKNTLPLTMGFHSLTFAERKSSGWDKALFVFSKIFKEFQFVWFLEDDVYIPSADAFFHLHNKVVRNNQVEKDLVMAINLTNFDGHDGWNWGFLAKDKMRLPWFGSLVPSLGASRTLLRHCSEYVEKRSKGLFLEVFFPTIAAHSNLRIEIPEEFASSIVFSHPWSCDDVKKNPMRWFHPVKTDLKCPTYHQNISVTVTATATATATVKSINP